MGILNIDEDIDPIGSIGELLRSAMRDDFIACNNRKLHNSYDIFEDVIAHCRLVNHSLILQEESDGSIFDFPDRLYSRYSFLIGPKTTYVLRLFGVKKIKTELDWHQGEIKLLIPPGGELNLEGIKLQNLSKTTAYVKAGSQAKISNMKLSCTSLYITGGDIKTENCDIKIQSSDYGLISYGGELFADKPVNIRKSWDRDQWSVLYDLNFLSVGSPLPKRLNDLINSGYLQRTKGKYIIPTDYNPTKNLLDIFDQLRWNPALTIFIKLPSYLKTPGGVYGLRIISNKLENHSDPGITRPIEGTNFHINYMMIKP